ANLTLLSRQIHARRAANPGLGQMDFISLAFEGRREEPPSHHQLRRFTRISPGIRRSDPLNIPSRCTRAISTNDGRRVISDRRRLRLRLGVSEKIWEQGTLIRCVKPQRDAQTRIVVGQLYTDLMERRNRFDQAEPKSTPRGTAAALQPIKALKHTYAFCG